MNTIEILEKLKSEYNLTSDYQISKKLGISRSRVSHYRTSNNSMGDELILKVEDLLEVPEGSLLLEMQAERTKCPEASKILHRLSKQLMKSAASVIITIIALLSYAPGAEASKLFISQINNNIHYAELINVITVLKKKCNCIFQRIFTIHQKLGYLEQF